MLSVFGMVPAVMMGIDVDDILRQDRPMVEACGPDAPPAANPGVQLGVILGEAAKAGRDKLTILTTPEPSTRSGAWLEQLIAEFTGKHGKGIVLVDLEPLSPPPRIMGRTASSRCCSLAGDEDSGPCQRMSTRLLPAGQPVVKILIADKYLIGQEFFRWEIATAMRAGR